MSWMERKVRMKKKRRMDKRWRERNLREKRKEMGRGGNR